MSRPTLLVDGDLILFRSIVAVEKEIQWDEENHVLWSNFEEAWHNIETAVERLFSRFDTDKHIIALSEGRSFRYDIDPTYKCNRQGQRKPLCYARCVETLRNQYRVYSYPGLEADDVLGIFSTRDKNTILISDDKDMRTVPCTLYAQGVVKKISPKEADYWHLYQTLVGDTADGYPGCPGVGPKKAEVILASPKPWEAILAAFEKAGLTAEDALKQARLARILRNSDWDDENKRPILWKPSSL